MHTEYTADCFMIVRNSLQLTLTCCFMNGVVNVFLQSVSCGSDGVRTEEEKERERRVF